MVNKYITTIGIALLAISFFYFRNKTVEKITVHDDEEHYTNADDLYSESELALFDGNENSKGLYLSILGSIFDVEKGRKHYGVGGTYHEFAGRDASIAFITGEANTKDDLTDVLTLGDRELSSLNTWKDFYFKEYIYKGKLIGRFYDENGDPTEYLTNVQRRVKEALIKKKELEDISLSYPSCNAEWTQETGSRVWCSDKSGGIERDWVGVPRKMFEPGQISHRCACIRDPKNIPANTEEYDNCAPNAISCFVKF